ncbi:MAG: transcriptional regulator NrdR [Bacillota bacterium]|nr:transcriptional regulator NrdR [Bacillota bacterium]
MRCPYCKEENSKVTDSRPTDDGYAIRRRRECLSCGMRFTTYENIERTPLLIIKKDGSRQEYNREKILRGIVRACEGRPISIKRMEEIVDTIEHNLNNTMLKEIESAAIGNEIMDQLKNIDEVAYVRFASVYKNFKDIDTFMQELQKLMEEKRTDK